MLKNVVALSLRRNLSYHHHVGKHPLRHTTVGKLLEETAAKHGDRQAIISRHQKQSMTFGEVLERADELAAGLVSLGMQKNDRLGLWAPNLIEWYVTKMACARAGFILVALNPHYQPPEMEYCINKVGIRTVISGDRFKSQDYHRMLAEIAPELLESEPGKLTSDKVPSLQNVITISNDSHRGAFNYSEIMDRGTAGADSIKKHQSSIRPDDPLNIQFTSGTTGKPKAAMVSHFSMVNNAYVLGIRNQLSEKHHKICVQVPLFHAFGLAITIVAGLNHASTLVLPTDGYSPNRSLDAIKEEKCTVIHGTPTMYVDLVHRQEERQEDISPEIAVSGGAICPPHLFEKMLKVLKVKTVKSVYGLTETTAVIFNSLPGESVEHAVSTVGHVSDHVEAAVVDGEGRTVPFGTPGELWIRGYCNMLGYWGDEEKTREMIRPDGWLRTGDQFVLREDGYGKIVGRLKEMLVRGGENIFPKEIEEFLGGHPGVLEVHVIGLPHERLGEEVCACIRLKPGTGLTHDDVVKFCKGKLADFKIPSRVIIVEHFPKTISGKIQKFKLVELATKEK